MIDCTIILNLDNKSKAFTIERLLGMSRTKQFVNY